MSLFAEIKQQNIDALKTGDKVKRSVYTLLLGEVGRSGDPKAIPSDLAVIAAASKIVAGIDEMIAKGAPDADLPVQRSILTALLPAQASEEDVKAFIAEYIEDHNPTMKEMGAMMSAVKEHFNGGIDGKVVSGLVRSALSK